MAEQKKGALLELLREMEKQGIDENNAVRHRVFGKYIDETSRIQGVPRMGVFELTPLCNLDCRMCYVHLDREQMRGQKLITGEQWISLMEQAIDRGMMYAQLSGGEAMMHPDFERIYRYLYERGIQITVMTNGILLDGKRMELFLQHPPTAIQMTMYGGSEETYERVTGHRVYERVKGNLLRAKEINCRLTVTATPSRYFGAKDVAAVRAFCRENDLTLKINADLNDAREETGRALREFNLPEEEYMEIRRQMVPEEMRKPVKQELLPPPGNAKEPAYGFQCGAGRSLFCVKWNGNMQACLDVPYAEKPFEIGFDEAWDRIHSFAVNYEIPRECQGCPYRSVCSICPVLHGQNAPKGHVDRSICERTRKLVQEGIRVLPENRENSLEKV